MTVVAGGNNLVINEVDYDQIMTDNAEYIEIFNPTSASISLTGKSVVLVNGSASPFPTYNTVDLSSATSLPANGYLVIAAAGVTVPGSGAGPSAWCCAGWFSA